jgi:hypothetical protein
MIKIPNTLIAENASETLIDSLWTNPSAQPMQNLENEEMLKVTISLLDTIKKPQRGENHQLCTTVFGLSFVGKVLKVSSLR